MSWSFVLVGAVDGELEALAQELVLDVLHAAAASRPSRRARSASLTIDLSRASESLFLVSRALFSAMNMPVKSLSRPPGEGDAERAAEDQDERRQQEHLADAPALHDDEDEYGAERHNDTDDAGRIQRPNVPGCSWTTLVGSASVSTVDRSGTACGRTGAPGACCARCCASATMLARYCRMRLITSGSDSATMYFLPSTSA